MFGTVMVLRFDHTRVNWESLKEHKGHIEKIVGELQAKQEGSRANLTDAHHRVTQLEQANAQLEAYNQDLEKKYQGLKKGSGLQPS